MGDVEGRVVAVEADVCSSVDQPEEFEGVLLLEGPHSVTVRGGSARRTDELAWATAAPAATSTAARIV